MAATDANAPATSFDALVAEMDLFVKAMSPAEKIDAAAKEAGMDTHTTDGATPGKKADEEEEEGAPEGQMAKSFRVTLPDGSVVDAVDGSEVIKALQTDLDAITAGSAAIATRVTATEQARDATMKLCTSMVSGLKSQDLVIKALQADLQRISNTGAGRKAVLTLAEKGAPAPAAATQNLNHEDFFAKALTLVGTGEWTSKDIALAEARTHHGLLPQQELIDAVAKIA